jgi:hypothetical protein
MATATQPIDLNKDLNLNENNYEFSQEKEHSKNININDINNDYSGNALNLDNLNINDNNEQNEEQKNNEENNNENNFDDNNNNEEQEEQKEQQENSNEYVNQISKFESQNPHISDKNINKKLPPIKNPPAYLSMVHMNPEIQNSYENNHISIGDYPFLTTGKFMQINPHFLLFRKNLRNLSDEIYNNTKRCLILKSSIQNSENILKQESNDVIIDVVEKIYMIKTMCAEEAKKVHELYKEVNAQFNKIIGVNRRLKLEVEKCEYKINHCENEIGYKLLNKPAYSFMKTYATTYS